MASEHEVERQFSENVDRLLAGQEVKIDPATETEERTATDFAQKMAALRIEPTSEFKAGLKARLLQELRDKEEETQAKEERSWLSRLWPRQRVWQAALAAVFIVVIGGAVWGILRPGQAPPRYIGGTILQVEANTNKAAYRPGEPVRIELSLKNVTSQPLQIKQLHPIISLMRAETRQPVYTFVTERADRTLAPGEAADFTISWDQRDDKGRYASSGEYYLELEDLEYLGQSMPLNLSRPVRFKID